MLVREINYVRGRAFKEQEIMRVDRGQGQGCDGTLYQYPNKNRYVLSAVYLLDSMKTAFLILSRT